MTCNLRWSTVGFLFAMYLLFASSIVAAHGGHDERLKLHLSERGLVFETHLPANALAAFDSDCDGMLTAAEFRENVKDIKDWVRPQVLVSTGDGTVLHPVFFDMPISEGDRSHDAGEVRFVRVRQHYELGESGGLSVAIKLREGEKRQLLFSKNGKIFRKSFEPGPINMVLD